MKRTGLMLILGLFLGLFCLTSYATTKRPPAVAGTFYPADSASLRAMIDGHLESITDLPEIDGQILALIVPHAGLIYSGQIAAHSYKLLEGSDIKKVILCGPSHRYRFDGLSVYGPRIVWNTPFGNISCPDDLCMQMLNFDERIDYLRQAHDGEHALEVQLPYLQTVLDKFEIVPVSMGRQDSRTIKLLAGALKAIDFEENTIMVASTDWQHYRSASEGWPMDSIGMACLANLDPVRLEKYIEGGKVEMCGGGPTVAVMKAAIARGADKVKILKYGDSGDLSGDKSKVVGYVAAVIYKSSGKESGKESKKAAPEEKKDLPKKFELSEEEKGELLVIARSTIENYLSNGIVPEFEVSDNLKKFGAAFVTLEKRGELRGCIGHTSAVEPLYKTVSTCAIQAAVSDRRFTPVEFDELKDIHIEISVLTPMQIVESWDEIEVGRDGLMIFKGNNRGLLLPQVAVDYNWDRITFLEQTCAKAGLPREAYKAADAVVYKFQAVIFGE